MIKNIIFDLVGVVLNMDLERDTMALQAAGLPDFEGCLKRPDIIGPVGDYINGLMEEDVFLERIRPLCKPGVTDDEIHWAMNAVLDDIPESRIKLLLSLRKKYKVYLLSNIYDAAWQHTKAQFAKAGYTPDDCFDKTFLSYEMQLAKPDPRIFQALISDTGIIPEETIFFDDTRSNIESARTLGFHAEVVPMNQLESLPAFQELL